MSGRALIDFARTRVHPFLARATERGKAYISERLRLLCEAAAQEQEP